jgi:hypothetical protein
MKHFILVSFIMMVSILLGITDSSWAQIMAHHLPGSWGLQSGSQHPEGLVVAPLYMNYGSDKIMDADGNELPNLSGGKRDIGVNALGLFAWWVSKYEILGAHYGVQASVPFADNQIEFASFNFKSGLGLADIYLQPVNLGWHLKQADFLATYGVYMPTGSYTAGATDNNGLGMWTHEFGAGTTLFFDAQKQWHFATTAYFELNGKKQDTEIDVGNTLTLEGGLGRSFFKGALSVGAAYYANWKVSVDKIGLNKEIPNLPSQITLEDKHQVYGLGPEVTLPVVIKGKLISLINARYFWELGAKSTLEGQRLVLFVIFPFFTNGG